MGRREIAPSGLEGQSSRASTYVLLPFAILALALAFFAFRSYQLSVRMERGVYDLGILYLDYASEIAARRGDAAVRDEMLRVAEEWQQYERTAETGPTENALQEWIARNEWIVSAIYVPDEDPGNSIFVSEKMTGEVHVPTERLLRHDFYTATGMVRYTYDPMRLLRVVQEVLKQTLTSRVSHLRETVEFKEHIRLVLVPTGRQTGLVKTPAGPIVIAPLGPPLTSHAVRAAFDIDLIAAGWKSHRIISLWFTALAVLVVTLGTWFALRGLRREQEAFQLRAALIANVSHELRTPLSMIRLGAETLNRGMGKLKDNERSEIQSSILREAIHLSHLVENVLDIARLRKSAKPMVFSPVSPAELVRSVVGTYESWIRSKGFDLSLDIDDAIGEQLWDRESLSRALLNLIDNAVKYSTNERHITVSLKENPDTVAIEVTDRGAGIRANEVSKIFDPYYRADFSDTETRRGAGLGLTLVQQIVQSHDGTIEVESVHGQGSTFRMLFPKQQAHRTEKISDLIKAAGEREAQR
jgi:signal transduction histidine kinase